MRRCLFAIVLLLAGCGATGLPGGRARLSGAGVVGDRAVPGGTGEQSAGGITLKTGITPLGWFLPDRDWDLEAGYVLEAFPDFRPLDVQGGYLGMTWVPTIVREYSGLFRMRFLGGLDAEVMGGVDRVVVGGTATIGIELAWFDASSDSASSLGQGFALATAGEWSLGIFFTGSYRHTVDQGHYGMIGGGINVRFPSAAAAGYVLPFGLEEQIRGETPEQTRARHRRRERMRERRRRHREDQVREIRRTPPPIGDERAERRTRLRQERRERRQRELDRVHDQGSPRAETVLCTGDGGSFEAETLADGLARCPDCQCETIETSDP